MPAATIHLLPSLHSLPMLAVAVAILILGTAVLMREGKSTVTLSFLGLTISVSVWLTTVSLLTMVIDPKPALLLARVAYVAIALIPSAVLQFTLSLIDAVRRWKKTLVAAWCGSVLFAILFTTTTRLLAGTWHYSWGFYPRLTELSATFLCFFSVLLGGSLVLLAATPARTTEERARRTSFLVALAVGYGGSVDFVPAFGVAIYPIGFVAILGFLLLAARAVLRFRMTALSPSFVADQLLATMQGGVIVVSMDGRIQLLNDAAADLLGWSREIMGDEDIRTLLGLSELPMTERETFFRRPTTRREVTWRRADGRPIELGVSASILRDENGESIGILYALADVADRRRAERNEFSATHDPLTRIPNRRLFAELFDTLKVRILEAQRIPTIFFVDLDGFKPINDRHGHAVGDAVLRIVASRIRNAVRGNDVVARYGGDEFVALLDLARMDDAALVGKKLLNVLSAPCIIDDLTVTLSASIGAAFYPRDGSTVDTLVSSADQAMYAAKRGGKARIAIRLEGAGIETPAPYSIEARA